jgi:hypothetical protein
MTATDRKKVAMVLKGWRVASPSPTFVVVPVFSEDPEQSNSAGVAYTRKVPNKE